MARVVSDGKSVRVTVPAATAAAVAVGEFCMFDGWFGWAVQGFTVAEVASVSKDIILNIEPVEYETSQGTVANTFTKGAPVFWNDTTKLLTTAGAGNRLVGRVTVAEDGNGVFWFRLYEQAGNVGGAAAPAAAIASLTDNSAGAANDTVEALADGTTYATDVAAIRNNFADLAAKVNAILAALRSAGIIAP